MYMQCVEQCLYYTKFYGYLTTICKHHICYNTLTLELDFLGICDFTRQLWLWIHLPVVYKQKELFLCRHSTMLLSHSNAITLMILCTLMVGIQYNYESLDELQYNVNAIPVFIKHHTTLLESSLEVLFRIGS